MKRIITITFLFISVLANAQMGVTAFLKLVENNNQEIIAAHKLTDAERLGYLQNITPENPTIEYGYLPGSNSGIGEKTIYGINQSLEFPTIYGVRKKIATQQGALSKIEFELFKMDKMLDAKNRFYDFIFLLKKEDEYKRRMGHAKNLLDSYQKQFDNGDASILDLNKSKIQYLNIKSNYELLEQDLASIRKELSLLSGDDLHGNISIHYQEIPLPNWDAIRSELEEQHPGVLHLAKNSQLANMQVKLARQSWLPNLELGFQGEIEQDGTFRGIVGGISIPLWKDKNKVKFAQAQADYQQNHLLTQKEIILTEYNKKYEKALKYASILNEFEQTLAQSANISFLDKALTMGQLSVIEYFNELAFYYQTKDKLLEIEHEYHLTLNELSDYKL